MDRNKFDEVKRKAENYRKALTTNKKPVPEGNLAVGIAVEIVAGGIAGLIIGLFLDNLFAVKPIFLIICLILSFIASFKSIWYKYK